MRYWRTKKMDPDLKISLVAAAFFDDDRRKLASVECFCSSIKAQTWPNWELLLVHDGPVADDDAIKKLIEFIDLDKRIRLLCTAERKRKFGHPWREYGKSQTTGDIVGMTNADNYYVPVYLEWMAHKLVSSEADFVYCDMIHSHKMWSPFKTSPKKSRIDLGAWLARGKLVRATKWPGDEFNADGRFVEALVGKSGKVVKLDAHLFVHN